MVCVCVWLARCIHRDGNPGKFCGVIHTLFGYFFILLAIYIYIYISESWIDSWSPLYLYVNLL